MDSNIAYLDNAATTRVCEESVQAAARMMRECYGNPSSLHAFGVESAQSLAQSREAVAQLFGAQPQTIHFTSGGSESNNLALFGAARARARRCKKIVTTAAEHASVSAACKYLEENGWEVEYVKPDADGIVQAERLAQATDENTALVSMMAVNNETGAVFPVEEAVRLVKAKNPDTLFHCDAVQAFGKLPVRLGRTGADLVSVSGHKICAPKGCGALYIRRGVRIRPLIFGGGQENGLRSGTENLPAIAAFGAACARLRGQVDTLYNRARALSQSLRTGLLKIPGVCINSPADASPYIMNLSLPGYRSEVLLHYLEGQGVYVSSGSACAKGAPSAVLSAMGMSRAAADSALRVSLIYDTALEQLDQFVRALAQAAQDLRR